jgi:hypothetical protein
MLDSAGDWHPRLQRSDQQAIAPGGIGRQESSPPIQSDVSIGMPVPQGPCGLILLSVIECAERE